MRICFIFLVMSDYSSPDQNEAQNTVPVYDDRGWVGLGLFFIFCDCLDFFSPDIEIEKMVLWVWRAMLLRDLLRQVMLCLTSKHSICIWRVISLGSDVPCVVHSYQDFSVLSPKKLHQGLRNASAKFVSIRRDLSPLCHFLSNALEIFQGYVTLFTHCKELSYFSIG